MVELISVGVNFITVLDECSEHTVTFKCRENVVVNDMIIENAKSKIYDFLDDADLEALFDLHKMGWFIETVSE